MTLGITRTTRWAAIATLLAFGGELSLPAAWAQAPSMPASGAPATGAPSAPAQKPSMPASGAPVSKPSGAPSAPTSPGARPAAPAAAGAPAASRQGTGNTPWPREATVGDQTYTVYQPQIEKWDGTRLSARAAVSIESAASPTEHFGVVWFSARAEVDKVNRLVALTDFRIDKVAFPSQPDRVAELQKVLERTCPGRWRESRSTGFRPTWPSPRRRSPLPRLGRSRMIRRA